MSHKSTILFQILTTLYKIIAYVYYEYENLYRYKK